MQLAYNGYREFFTIYYYTKSKVLNISPEAM